MDVLVAPSRATWQHVAVEATPKLQLVTVDRHAPPRGQLVEAPSFTTAASRCVAVAVINGSEVLAHQVRALRDAICRDADFTREQIARLIGVDRRSVTGWANGTTRPTSDHLRALNRLHTLTQLLTRLQVASAATLLLDEDAIGETVAWVQKGEAPDIQLILGQLSTTEEKTMPFVVNVTIEQAQELTEELQAIRLETSSRNPNDDPVEDEPTPSFLKRDPSRYAPNISIPESRRVPDGHVRNRH